MSYLILNAFAYTFAAVGIVLLFKQLGNIFKNKSSKNRIIIVIDENEENTEQLIKTTYNFVNSTRMFSKGYIVRPVVSSSIEGIIDRLDNEFFEIIEPEEIQNKMILNDFMI